MVSEAKHKSGHGEGFKIWAPKQMLQRLPIAFGQVKSVNTFTNLKTFKMKCVHCIKQKKCIWQYNNSIKLVMK